MAKKDKKNKNEKIKKTKTKKEIKNKEVEKENKKNRKKGKKLKFKDKHPRISLAIKLFIILFLVACFAAAGIIIGLIYGAWGEEFEISKDELAIAASNTVILDSDGNKIADLSGDERRKIITLEQMSEYLPKAYIAIEDERFYEHSGVDLKRTGYAIFTYITHGGNSSFGGSTITQQLVKNITKDDDRDGTAGIQRKVKEWAKAYQVEQMLSKDQILELYLNILFVGEKNHGVELGAQYYFNKSAAELDIAECAFLAGINSAPNAYSPYKEGNEDKIKNKTKTVLGKMLELGSINKEQYDEAVAKVDSGLPFQKGGNAGNIYSYHTDALLDQVINQVAQEKEISTTLAQNYVYSSGLTIYSTQNTTLQKQMEEEFNKDTYKEKSRVTKNENGEYVTTQAAMVIIDNNTHNVVATVGGIGEKTDSRGLNRATQSMRQTGSAMKPIAAVAPALEERIITAATRYQDLYTIFAGKYDPKNSSGYKGNRSIRQAIETSQNIPFIKVMAELTPTKSLQYLRKMGITTLDDTNDAGLALAIGGLYKGISVLEMAGAYSMIACDGVYTTPTFYSKIEDADGNIVLTPKQESTRVVSEQSAYVLQKLLQQPVIGGSGTARSCTISGMDVAAKTGTTNSGNDRWLCGFTNYYSAATWFGYDKNEKVRYSGGNPAGKIWTNVMRLAHNGKGGSRFEKPSGIVSATICSDTGLLATDSCVNKYSEIFIAGTVPKACDGHEKCEVCTESGKLANEYCPSKETKYNTSYILPKEQTKLWNTKMNNEEVKFPTEVCTTHKKEEQKKPEDDLTGGNSEGDKKPTEATGGNGNTSGGATESSGNTTEGNKKPTGGSGNTTGGTTGGSGNTTGGTTGGNENTTGGTTGGNGNTIGGATGSSGNTTGGTTGGSGNTTGGTTGSNGNKKE